MTPLRVTSKLIHDGRFYEVGDIIQAEHPDLEKSLLDQELAEAEDAKPSRKRGAAKEE